MIRVEVVARIERPIEDVFERLVDIDGYGEWMGPSWLFVETGQRTSGAVGEGTEMYDRTRLGIAPGVVVDLERPTRVAFCQVLRWKGTTVFESRPAYILEPDGEATIVQHIAEGRLYGAYRLMEPLVALMAHAERRRILRTLQRSFERGVAPDQPGSSASCS